ncbi:Diguanylate cyclase [Candidatus Terasakiella magnetica]|uniref:Diguanylate cyclase DosC n=1 Tax=Candidatus Terasakiella magnetica TaxID=1867952 RepID=A0A1C3RLT5_9PROT|nr:GGDEF domain-containing protein [Candidatus Terasakiella magnetica]SCA58237.1 Diguanylate cyclase [Candidatus Terasakiella magnetica]
MEDFSSHSGQLTGMTLAEQLKITERDIEQRKELIGFYKDDEKALVECKSHIQENLEQIVDEFYNYQRSVREIQVLIGDAETFRRLHGSMKRYVSELFEGYYDSTYVNRRLRIGKVHNSIGVSPKLYISSLSRLEAILYRYVTDACEGDLTKAFRRSAAMRKLLMLDIQLVFDTYINSMMSEVLVAKDELENYAGTLEQTVAERTRQLEEMSRSDGLTKLQNQRSFYERLRHEIAVAERNETSLSLVYFDLNKFKDLNDKKGHREGDALLARVGHAMLETARTSDICCRYGGDEFAVIMPGTDWTASEKFCDRLQACFDKGETHGVTFSMGVSETGPDKFSSMDELVTQGDEAMYRAKAASRIDGSHQMRHYLKPKSKK